MGQALAGLITVGLMIYALVDCVRSGEGEVRALPKAIWLLVILVPLAGAVGWLVYGAPRVGPGGSLPRSRVTAPDDDPDFLRTLDAEARERRRTEREERRRLAKEQRREEKDARREEKDPRREDKPQPDKGDPPPAD
jgi:Phospholipase_D-nuclease N-terminal